MFTHATFALLAPAFPVLRKNTSGEYASAMQISNPKQAAACQGGE